MSIPAPEHLLYQELHSGELISSHLSTSVDPAVTYSSLVGLDITRALARHGHAHANAAWNFTFLDAAVNALVGSTDRRTHRTWPWLLRQKGEGKSTSPHSSRVPWNSTRWSECARLSFRLLTDRPAAAGLVDYGFAKKLDFKLIAPSDGVRRLAQVCSGTRQRLTIKLESRTRTRWP